MSSVPFIVGPENIRYDFQDGCRVLLPPGSWEVEIFDLESQSIVVKTSSLGGLVSSPKKYFVPYRLRVYRAGELIFEHRMRLQNQTVLVDMHIGGIGDHLAWMGHVEQFAHEHECTIVCLVRNDMRELFEGQNARIQITDDPAVLEKDFYAMYRVLVFFNDVNRDHQPMDFRQVGLVVCAAYILGLTAQERRPSIRIATGPRPIEEKYVCIASQATGHAKLWNNPHGWYETIRFLKANGYRVICIDRERVNGDGTVWNRIPHGAEDMTGAFPLSERARYLRHADFFIGLTSGLSWLAWSVGTPVVLISGFTEPLNEFHTPYRVINKNICSGCANDVTIPFKRDAYLWCPRFQKTDRDFECTKKITSQHVVLAVQKVMTHASSVRNTHE